MALSVVMPALEMAQETGKLVSWRKQEGDRVSKGDVLLEVETDKAVIELEASGDGILAGIKAQAGAVVPVGQTIAWIVAPGEAPPQDVAPASTARRTSAVPTIALSSAMSSAAPAATDARISPKARRLAKEHGVDISQLRGSGPGGEILAADIVAAASKSGSPAGAAELSSVARLMAERTAQSWTTVPHFFLAREIDATALVEARKKMLPKVGPAGGIRPSLTDFLVALVARALVKHPQMNASWKGDSVRNNPDVNMAVAMAVKDGVVGAVIPKANTLTVADIAVQRSALTERARAGKLRPADIAAATFTISNLGMYSVDAFIAIITPPQAAVLAVGSIVDRVVPVDGKPGIRPMMTLTLSSDHRVVDGVRAAQFLDEVTKALGAPNEWLA
jgi:pyruvate dehydrogenase E2 component (dihydrolipoyllysine-residue acetyltransferase)